MPQPKDPKRLLLSWRQQRLKFGANTQDWLDLFKVRMRYQCRDSFEVIDVLERGTTKADQREGPWTEFMAVFTMDYLEACRTEPDHELLTEVLHELKAGVEGKRYWVTRLESANLNDITIGPDNQPCKPWAEYSQWHRVPEDDFIDTMRSDLSTVVDRECITKLKSHGTGCKVCERRPRDDTP